MDAPLCRLPATTAQYGIWIAQQSVPDNPLYMTGEAIELRGILDVEALTASIRDVLDNCQSLHLYFERDEERLWQYLLPPACPPVPLIDFSDQENPRAAAEAWMQAALEQPCNLAQDPLYQTAVLRLDEQLHLWYLQAHHVALDGFAYSLLGQAVAERYSARQAGQPLPDLPNWALEPVVMAEQRYREEGGFAADQAFWVQQLENVPAPALLKPIGEFPRHLLRRDIRLDEALVQDWQAAARHQRQSWGNWMLAAIGLWLGRQSGQSQLTLGLPVMNRLGTPALGIPCMAMNIVPLSMRLDEAADLAGLSQQVTEQMKQMRPHLYYRYGWMRMDLGLMESGGHLFNQAVNLMPFDRQMAFAGLQKRILPITAGPVKDLNISLAILDSQWQLLLEANPESYSSEELKRLQESLLEWLQQAPLLQKVPLDALPVARLLG